MVYVQYRFLYSISLSNSLKKARFPENAPNIPGFWARFPEKMPALLKIMSTLRKILISFPIWPQNSHPDPGFPGLGLNFPI